MVDPPSTTAAGISQAVPEPGHQAYLDRKYLPELDGLRALSVLIVISVHMKDQVWAWLAGALGVTIFFVLSGYLITRLALNEERHTGTLNKRAFFVRRTLRLFPVYYAVLGVYCVLIFGLKMSPEKNTPFALALPFYMTYLQDWPFFLGINGSHRNIPFYQTWTLGIEEKFYLIWPLLGFVIWRRQATTRRFGTLALAILTALAPTLFGQRVGQFFYFYSQILIGCLVALLLDDAALYDRIRRALINTPALVVVFLLVGVLHFSNPYLSGTPASIHNIAYAVAWGLALVILILTDGPIQRFLRWSPLLWVGRLSYGMYLVHLLALNAAEKVARPGSGNLLVATTALVLAWIISAAIAYFLAVTVERPGIAAGRRLSNAILQRSRAAKPARAVVAGGI